MRCDKIAYVLVSLACCNCGGAPGESGDVNVDAKQEKSISSDIDKINNVIKPYAELASNITSVYSGVGTAIDVLKTFGLVNVASAEEAQFNALAQQITNLGSAFTWYVNASSVDQTLRALNADMLSAQQQVQQSQQHPNDPSYPLFTTASAAYVGSAEKAAELESDLHFIRYWDPSAYPPKGGALSSFADDWVNHIPLPSNEPFLGSSVPGVSGAAGSQSFIYDWRLGVPAMMSAIATRVQMIAAADPGFTLASTRQELLQHRTTLLSHYNRMVSGIKCTTVDYLSPLPVNQWNSVSASEQLNVFCVDTSTGYALAAADAGNVTFSAYGQHDPNDTTYRECLVQPQYPATIATHDPKCITAVDVMLATGHAAAAAKQTELYNAVMDGLPLYEMRALINTLYVYASPSQDLTTVQQRIQELGAGMCLDIQWGNTVVGNPLWSWPCSGNFAQWWRYDRKTARIVNPASQLCLDAVPQTGTAQLAVQLATCSDTSKSQRWSYDPERTRIYSGATSTGILIGVGLQKTLVTVGREIVCPAGQFCGNHTGEFWFSSQAPHGLCQSGAVLTPSADDSQCASRIITADSYCGIASWDTVCVKEVATICGESCSDTMNGI